MHNYSNFVIYASRILLTIAISLMFFNVVNRDALVRLSSSPDLLDVIILICLAVAVAVGPIALLSTKFEKTRLISWRKGPTFIIIISGLALSASVWIKNESAGAILLASILATLGWIVIANNNRDSARKQHTMNVLLQMRNNPMLEFHILNILKKYPMGNNIKKEDVDSIVQERKGWNYIPVKGDIIMPGTQASVPVLESVIWLANYYEFICLGVIQGDLDPKMIRNSYKNSIFAFYKKTHHVLDYFQKSNPIGQPKTSYLNSMRIMYARWEDE